MAVVAATGLLVFLVAPDDGLALGAAWIAFLVGLSGAVVLTCQASKRLVGDADHSRRGYRNIAVAAAVLIGAAVSPLSGQQAATFAGRIGEAIFVETPELLQPAPDAPDRMRNAAVARLYLCVTAGACGESTANGSGDSGVSLLLFGAAFLAVLLLARAISEARAVFNDRMHAENSELAAERPGAAVVEDGAGRPQRRAGDRRFSRPNIMPYPTWVAFLIYALILTPATYLAVGSLLHLRTEPPAANSTELALELEREGTAAMQAMAGVEGLSFETLKRAAEQWTAHDNALDTAYATARPGDDDGKWATAATATAEIGRAMNEEIVVGRAVYEADAIRHVRELNRRAEASDMTDYRTLLTSRYRYAIQSARSQRRPCLEALAALQRSLAAPVPAPAPSPSAVATPEPSQVAAARSDRLTLIANRTADADARCAAAVAPFLTASRWDAVGVLDGGGASEGQACRGAQCGLGFGSVLTEESYAWLAEASQSTVLIAGLVGFGLFGAAIRMMGRVDRTSVTPEELAAARLTASVEAAKIAPARRDAEQAQQRVAAAQQACVAAQQAADAAAERLRKAEEASRGAEEGSALQLAVPRARTEAETASRAGEAPAGALREAEAAAAAAASVLLAAEDSAQANNEFYQQLKRRQLNDRSNIVVKRLSRGREEFVVSGAAAKVFVQGLGAAFTVFLAGQAAGRLLAEGGRVSVYSLLLSCFVGAVFAEEIWRWAKKFLPKDEPPAAPARQATDGTPAAA